MNSFTALFENVPRFYMVAYISAKTSERFRATMSIFEKIFEICEAWVSSDPLTEPDFLFSFFENPKVEKNTTSAQT